MMQFREADPMTQIKTRIPFLDLVTPHCELQEELLNATRTSLQTGCFVGGPLVAEFERGFAEFCETGHCVGVGSGTDALRFAIMAAGIGDGDVVITVPNTFIATTEAISQAGAKSEFVDVDERTCNMDANRLRDYLETQCILDTASGKLKSLRSVGRIAAVIPVHLYGQMADMDAIMEVAEQYDLPVIEDACQAHGAQYFSTRHNRWLRAGSMGRAAAFSFYPGKNLGACGEAGAVTTDDKDLASRVRVLRDHGQSQKYFHDLEGYNGRLDAIQAGFLNCKLPRLAQWNGARRVAARRYHDLFVEAGTDVLLPYEPSWSESVYHLYVIRTRERDRLRETLHERGIETGIHYPIPLHLQKAYKHMGYKSGDFPIAERASAEILSLPMFPTLRADEQQNVVSTIHNLLSEFTAEAGLSVEFSSK
jgi:dTDP-4-amino-4,6-dideoxygalactose transaminase